MASPHLTFYNNDDDYYSAAAAAAGNADSPHMVVVAATVTKTRKKVPYYSLLSISFFELFFSFLSFWVNDIKHWLLLIDESNR